MTRSGPYLTQPSQGTFSSAPCVIGNIFSIIHITIQDCTYPLGHMKVVKVWFIVPLVVLVFAIAIVDIALCFYGRFSGVV